jgi:succinate dehydrogenase/fumarate reductase flavoprotein subunit
MSSENLVETDVLVIGGAIAGCFAAIRAREQGLDVTIVDKAYAGKSGASIDPDSTMWLAYNSEWGHDFSALMNTVNVMCEYINNREWSEIIVKEAWARYQDLVSWGAELPLDRKKWVREYGPFSSIRLRHRKHVPALRKRAEKVGVKVMDRIMVTDLLKRDGEVAGAIGFSYDTGDLYIFKAKATVLSAGGNSFKPPGFHISCLTGDAEAMAYRVDAEIAGKEFLSTHPTNVRYPAWSLHGGTPIAPLLKLIGREILPWTWAEEHLDREVVVHAGKGPLFWDIEAPMPKDIEATLKEQLPEYFYMFRERLGPGKLQLAGGGMAGYLNVGTGGIWVINTKCATSLPGLYAAGDCGGARQVGAFHPVTGFGLASAAVTGRRAGVGSTEYALQTEKPVIDQEELARLKKIVYAPMERKGGFSPRWVTQLLQNTMMPYFILFIKHEERLQAALTIVEFLRDHLVPKLTAKDLHELRLAHETKNMVLNAEMILRSSLFRTESRGVHYREDYPRRDDPAWLAWVKIKQEQGRMKLLKEPVPKKWWPDLSKPYKERYPLRFPGE